MSKFLYKIFEGMIRHLVCLFEEGRSKLLIKMFHLVPCTLMCTCCSKSMAAMLLSLLLFLPALRGTFGATKVTDWTATLTILLVEVHIVASAAAEGGR